jgi:hypothetical protein
MCRYKARPQQLYLPKRFHDNKARLPDAGVMGTNKAFLGKYDGRGQSTKVCAMGVVSAVCIWAVCTCKGIVVRLKVGQVTLFQC